MRRAPALTLLIIALGLGSVEPQDLVRFSRIGVSFEHPREWTVSHEISGGVPTVTATNNHGAAVTITLHPPGTNPIGLRSQSERALVRSHPGKLVDGSEKTVMRKFPGGGQEGVALQLKTEEEQVVEYELYAFPLSGKKRVICLVKFQRPTGLEESAKHFSQIAATLMEEGPAGPGGPRQSPPVSLAVPVPQGWELRPVKRGAALWIESEYAFTQLPKEVEGGHLVFRPEDQIKHWLAADRIRADRDCSAYAIFRSKYLGNTMIDGTVIRKLLNDGWGEVYDGVRTNFPAGEDWGWRIFKRDMSKGEEFVQLKGMTWGQPIVFIFK